MGNQLVFLIALFSLSSLAFQGLANVNEFEGKNELTYSLHYEVQALHELYTSLNTPEQLQGWKVAGGDPCRDSWLGVECFESTILHLKLQDLGLNGTLGSKLSNLKDLKFLDLSSNIIEGSIPDSLPLNVIHLNLSHNSLSGPLGDVFKGLHNLREMDLSFNNLSGDLPTSFQSLPNLTRLFLQNNQFTGSLIFLANLTLSDLNIEDNHFSGMIPEKLKDVHNLWIGGNPPAGQNISSPPLERTHSRVQMRQEIIILSYCCVFLILTTSAFIAGFCRETKTGSSNRTRMPKEFTVEELQQATHSFSEISLGEGCLGPIYEAELLMGQGMVVKKIRTEQLSITKGRLLAFIKVAGGLRHPYIVKLIGYCMKDGFCSIMYDLIKNAICLDDALHNSTYVRLSWTTRFQIALRVALALEYLHSRKPPFAHGNLKAANILLDEDMKPHLCDCGALSLRSLTSNSADSGYLSPEHDQHGKCNTKADVYAFGVLLLELLTGRKPLDSSRPELEQSLVKWASPRLYDCSSLRQMVDPTIEISLSDVFLKCYGVIVSLCIESKESRPPMFEIVDALEYVTRRLVA